MVPLMFEFLPQFDSHLIKVLVQTVYFAFKTQVFDRQVNEYLKGSRKNISALLDTSQKSSVRACNLDITSLPKRLEQCRSTFKKNKKPAQ